MSGLLKKASQFPWLSSENRRAATTEWHVNATVRAHAQTFALGLDVIHEPAANGREIGQISVPTGPPTM